MSRELLSLLVVIAVAAGASSLWRGHVADEDGERLKALAKPGDIRMISSESCGWCTVARRWFKEAGAPFEECFIEHDAACAQEFVARGAQGTPTLIVRGQTVVGLDRLRLLKLLEPSR